MDFCYKKTKMSSGWLEIIIGPMFSGKTSKLVSFYKHNKIAEIPTCVINYYEDTRYCESGMSTHDNITIPCVMASTITSIIENKSLIEKTEAFIINEGQFFPDLFEGVKILLNKYKKRIYVCGLDGDFKMQKFGTILDLIPLCDKVEKLVAICTICKSRAPFTKRLSNESEQKVIGSKNYIPVCRSCHKEHSS